MAVQGLNTNVNINLNGITQINAAGKYRGRGNLFMSMLNMVMSGSGGGDMLSGLIGENGRITNEIIPDGNQHEADEQKPEVNLNQISAEELLRMYGSLVELPGIYDENVLTVLRDSVMLRPNSVQDIVQGVSQAERDSQTDIAKLLESIANATAQSGAESPGALDAVTEQFVKLGASAENPNNVQSKAGMNERLDVISGADKMQHGTDSGLESVDSPVVTKIRHEVQEQGMSSADNNREASGSDKKPADSLMSNVTVYEKPAETSIREVTVQVSDESSQIKSELMAHVKDEITVAVKDGKQEINMELYPKELGKINIKLNVEDGMLKVVIKADNPEVQSIIKSASAELSQALKSGAYENVVVKTIEPETMHIRTPEMFDRNAQSDMSNHQGNHDNRRHNEYYAEDIYGNSDDDTTNLSFEEFAEMMRSYRV